MRAAKDLGGNSSEVPPLPIPNREVKLAYADGTAFSCGRVGSRLFKVSLNGLTFFYVVMSGYVVSYLNAKATDLEEAALPPPFVRPPHQTSPFVGEAFFVIQKSQVRL